MAVRPAVHTSSRVIQNASHAAWRCGRHPACGLPCESIVSYIVAESWADRHSDALTAFGTLAAAGLLLLFLDRFVAHRLDTVLNKREIGAKSSTRLRFSWRVLESGIAVVALAIALDQFADLSGI